MLKLKDVAHAGGALAEKSVGLLFEAVGTFTGNERLKEAGRRREDAASDRLSSIEEEAKAARRSVEAEAYESRQKAHQPRERRSEGRDYSREPSAAHAAGEGVKGAVKQAAGAISQQEDLRAEGEAQRSKARSEAEQRKHEVRAEAERKKAEIERERSERIRRSR